MDSVPAALANDRRVPNGVTLLAAALLMPCGVFAQSTELLRDYQSFEAAEKANHVPEALRYGQDAITRSEAEGNRDNLIELLRNIGDYAAHVDAHATARRCYLRALELQEAELGPEHPDLVPVLTDLADLDIKDKRLGDAAALLERISKIEIAAYGDRHENVLATLRKLRGVYADLPDAAAVARIDAQIHGAAIDARAPVPTRGSLPPPPSVAAKDRRYKATQGFATVRVYYGTNRAPSGDAKPALYYGPARGDLQYGYLDVTIPQIHQEAQLETQPRWVEYTFAADQAAMRTRYVLLDQVTPLAKDDFVRDLRRQISGARSQDVFIFVHGYNNTFEDAARRAAQLAYDLDFDGTPLMYSWPSQGSTTGYATDEAAVGISGRRMAEFLETVVAESGARRIHLIAHSMGNRALIEALQTYLAKRAPENRQGIFGQIVLTAPDVDRDYFTDAIQSLTGSAERITLYASKNDYAMRSSEYFHGAPRAGSAGDVIVKLAGLDSIDMSAVPADALGHSYFAANSGAIYDLFRLLWRGDPPPQRCGMSNSKAGGTLTVWLFNADECKGDDMLEAGVMLKRFGELARAHVLANIAALTDPTQKQEWSLILQRLDGLLPLIAPQASGAPK